MKPYSLYIYIQNFLVIENGMKKLLFFLIAFGLSLIICSSCHNESNIIDRELNKKKEIEKLHEEIKTWDKQSLINRDIQLDGDPHKLGVKEFYKGIFAEKGVLIDIRSPKEFSQNHIIDAKNVDFYDDNFKTAILKYDKETPVFIYCQTGTRSQKATRILTEMGYEVYNLASGFKDWTNYKMPFYGDLDHGSEEGC